jgi:hypothetical protein
MAKRTARAKGLSSEDRHALFKASPEQLSVTTFPMDSCSDLIARRQSVHLLPGGTQVLYTSGPTGKSVSITLSRAPNYGGHNHGGGPYGSIVPSSFVLDGEFPQNIQSVFKAPEAAGIVVVRSVCSNGQSAKVWMFVEVPGLIGLGGGVGIVLTGSTPAHPSNHFGTGTLVSKIRQLATAFHSKFSKDIFVNDMSLPSGGLFDYKGTWAPPHATHREGRTVDINSTSMSPEEQGFFRQTASSIGFRVALESNPPHWHLTI